MLTWREEMKAGRDLDARGPEHIQGVDVTARERTQVARDNRPFSKHASRRSVLPRSRRRRGSMLFPVVLFERRLSDGIAASPASPSDGGRGAGAWTWPTHTRAPFHLIG
jgi:hypothetical protein